MKKLSVQRWCSPLRATNDDNDEDNSTRCCCITPPPQARSQSHRYHDYIIDDDDVDTVKSRLTVISKGAGTSATVGDRQAPTLFSDITLVCENLITAGKFERLERLLWAMPLETDRYKGMEILLVAKCYLTFRKGRFAQLYEMLQSRHFSKRYHRQLQFLWRTARYIEAERARGRALGSVGKYRIRRKFPLPYTIWDGECMSYCFREEARDILNATYKVTPYPSAQEKYAMAQQAKLSVTQVSNWFKNKRQRARAKKDDACVISEKKTR